jgi:argininosuccinate lyase
MKLWQKNDKTSADSIESKVEKFTVGKDREFDLQLAPFDIIGNIAHAEMLASVGLLTNEENDSLRGALQEIYRKVDSLTIDEGTEDIHSQVEAMLTERLGDVGKKIHAARSRNDQVLLDIKLFLRNEIEELVNAVHSFFTLLQQKSDEYKSHLLPGYTHLQIAMPSSFGLWFGAYAESLLDDTITLQAAWRVVNKNPLGSAAGYGSSFPIDRSLTTKLLGFEELAHNVVYAQMGRGKTERIVAQSLSNVADTMAKLSMDACLFMNQNFNFISFPAALTTGSSIMPHKKNPDVFELVRAHCNRIKALPNEISMITTNLPSGYHRDLQLLKEHLFPAFQALKDCMEILSLMIENVIVKEDILADDKYKYLFSVEAVNELVLQGMPFREAYKKIGNDIESGSFKWEGRLAHTHAGSIGDLQNGQIKGLMEAEIQKFQFESVKKALSSLLNPDPYLLTPIF